MQPPIPISTPQHMHGKNGKWCNTSSVVVNQDHDLTTTVPEPLVKYELSFQEQLSLNHVSIKLDIKFI